MFLGFGVLGFGFRVLGFMIYSLHCSSFLGLPYRIPNIKMVTPKIRKNNETIGSFCKAAYIVARLVNMNRALKPQSTVNPRTAES